MNDVHPNVQSAGTSFSAAPRQFSDYMLFELLTMHEELIERLRIERLGGVNNDDFLTGMIEEHEKAATMIRALIESHRAKSA